MEELHEKYKPRIQKSLFHNSTVTSIRKWLQNVDASDNHRHVLLVCGPVGCGKTVTLDVLLKQYSTIQIDADDIRTQDKLLEVTKNCVGYNNCTLTNIDKTRANKCKKNIVVIENVEQCEKTIRQCIELIHIKNHIDTPVILVSTKKRIREIMKGYPNTCFVEFPKPSLLETHKLVSHVNCVESLQLQPCMVTKIIEHVECDLRQIYAVLSQWKLRRKSMNADNCDFDIFLSSFDKKKNDLDLYDTICQLFGGNNKDMSVEETLLLSSCEPLVMTNTVFQNYINVISASDLEDLTSLADSAESLSMANIYNNQIYRYHHWDLTTYYALHGVAVPSFLVRRQHQQLSNVEMKAILNPFRDVSYNYNNSFNDVRNRSTFDILKMSSDMTVSVVIDILKQRLARIEAMLSQEDIEVCASIIEGYKMYETDGIELFTDEDLFVKKNLNKINLRPIKKFLNIFAMKKQVKMSKKTEQAICKEILKNLHTNKSVPKKIDVDDLVCDLSDIWSV